MISLAIWEGFSKQEAQVLGKKEINGTFDSRNEIEVKLEFKGNRIKEE